MRFGLACEGVTDYILIKNILRGYFPSLNYKKQIRQLQPLLDETDEKQLNDGGWEKLLAYLESVDFYDAVDSDDYIIIQIDTDESKHINFNVSHYNENNEELKIEQLIENVKKKLISVINKKDNLYEEYAEKIIFAISVHSLECWLYAYYKLNLKNPKTKRCCDSLQCLFFPDQKKKTLMKEQGKSPEKTRATVEEFEEITTDFKKKDLCQEKNRLLYKKNK